MAPSKGPRLLARKSLEEALAETEKGGFKRALGPLDLTSIGVAAIIGAGIFFFLGDQARTTGPAVMISLLVGGIAAILSAFTYAEFASLLPGSGSAYLYAYAALGRFPAFMLGWIILNAYLVGNSTVAIAWASYLTAGLSAAGLVLPEALTSSTVASGGFNLPAAGIMVLVTLLTLPRIRESTIINNLLVALKLCIVLFIIVFGATLVRPSNWTPFNPAGWQDGILPSAAVLFFAYLGYDTVAATAEESKRPRRDLPLGILLSVGLSMLLYIAMAAVVTGMTAQTSFPADRPPVAAGFQDRGYPWAFGVITAGAVIGLATVLYAFQIALARILHSMAKDGFLPQRFGRLHEKTGTPWAVTLWTGGLAALLAGVLPVDQVQDMAVLASIVMYIFVAAGVLVLQILRPEAERRFRTHWTVSAAAAVILLAIAILGIGLRMHLFFLAYVALGLIVYGFYAGKRAKPVAGEVV